MSPRQGCLGETTCLGERDPLSHSLYLITQIKTSNDELIIDATLKEPVGKREKRETTVLSVEWGHLGVSQGVSLGVSPRQGCLARGVSPGVFARHEGGVSLYMTKQSLIMINCKDNFKSPKCRSVV